MLVTQLCLTLCDRMDCSLPGSSVQVRITGVVAISFSRESSWTKHQTWVFCIAGRFFTIWATREAPENIHRTHTYSIYWLGNGWKYGYLIFHEYVLWAGHCCKTLCVLNFVIFTILWWKCAIISIVHMKKMWHKKDMKFSRWQYPL